jgi:hypothetical protein
MILINFLPLRFKYSLAHSLLIHTQSILRDKVSHHSLVKWKKKKKSCWLSFCGLFYDSVSISNYRALNDGKTDEWWVAKLEGSSHALTWGTCLEGLRKITKVKIDSWQAGQDLYWPPTEYSYSFLVFRKDKKSVMNVENLLHICPKCLKMKQIPLQA